MAKAGPASVLKLMIPRDGDHTRNEITVLRLAGGDGCVRLLRADQDRGGVVERVSTGLLATGIGLQPVGREMLATADLLAGYDPASL